MPLCDTCTATSRPRPGPPWAPYQPLTPDACPTGAGHSNTRTTEVVYRRELRPVLTTGAEAMDRLFPNSSGPVRGIPRQRTKSGHQSSSAAQ
jgi:hypothetical protein